MAATSRERQAAWRERTRELRAYVAALEAANAAMATGYERLAQGKATLAYATAYAQQTLDTHAPTIARARASRRGTQED